MAIIGDFSVSKIKAQRIGVFMGGPSSEREISLKSGKAVIENLTKLDFNVVAIDVKSVSIEEVITAARREAIDVAFIALHGYFGEDGQLQSILESISIP